MQRSHALAALAFLGVLLAGGVTVKRGPGKYEVAPGMTGTSGNEATLAAIYELREFQDAGPFLIRQWVDPYNGSDVATQNGSYLTPFKSLARLKEQCYTKPHQRCTIKGRNRVLSPLTFVVDGVVAGDQFQRGEALSWAAGASTGTVLDWDGSTNTLVIARLTGTDPDCCAVTFIGTQSGANVTDVSRADTLGGHVTELITAFTDAGDVVTAPGHYYVNNEGPMRLFSGNNDLPAGLAEATDFFICDVIAGTSFTLDTDSDCSGASTAFGASASVTTQITGFSNTQIINTISMTCTDRDRICTLVESEFGENPATIDSNGFYPVGVSATSAEEFWGGATANGACPTSCFPTGGIFVVGGTLAGGWLGIQNLTVQNIALDAFSTIANGKLVVLNSPGLNIRNGDSDRSTTTAANPERMSHNSLVTCAGDGGASNLGSACYYLNGRGNGDLGSEIGSGGLINPNEEGAMRVISTGDFSVASITADNNCAGLQCQGSVVVAPNGDVVFLGPTFLGNSVNIFSNLMTSPHGESAGPRTRKQIARVIMNNRTNAAGSDIINWAELNAETRFILNEVTMRMPTTAGTSAAFEGCGFCFDEDCVGAGGPATDGAAFFTLHNVLVDDVPLWWIGSDCGDPVNRDGNSDVTRVTMDWQGYFDDEDAAGADVNEWQNDVTSFITVNSFLTTAVTGVNALLTGAGRPTTQWSLFALNSQNSGAGADGIGWTTDTLGFRCTSGQLCFNAGAVSGAYTVDFTTNYGGDPDDACLPADVLGAKLCGLQLIPTHIGAR